MFDDLCHGGAGKYAFPMMMMGSLALHVWDVASDILVAILLYHEDKVFFGISIGVMVLGSLFGSFASVIFGSLKSRMEGGNGGSENENTPAIDASTVAGCLCGLTQLEIFVDAYFSIRLGKKTQGFVFTRLFEGMVESAPQSLLQLYIVLKRADGVIDGEDVLLFASIGTSVVSMAVGVSQFERWSVKGDRKYVIPLFSRYNVALNTYHMLEIAARMGLLACVGIAWSGWAIFGMLLFDYLMIIGIVVITVDDKCDGAFLGALLGVGCLASQYFGFSSATPDIMRDYLKYHWLPKTLEGFVMIPFIVVKLTQAHTYSFMLFSVIGMACFVLQYVPLFYLLKWASNATKDRDVDDKCPQPSEVFVFPFCSKNLDDSVGGVLKWKEYEAQQKEKEEKKKKEEEKKMTKITPVQP
eukprot:g65.t1